MGATGPQKPGLSPLVCYPSSLHFLTSKVRNSNICSVFNQQMTFIPGNLRVTLII